MLPMMLAKRILELDESDLIRILQELEMTNREIYETIKEKIEDL